MLVIDGIRKTYPGKKPVQALKDLSFTVSDGTVTALLGPNGAGKSTLLNCINGLVLPDTGEISIGGVSVIKRRKQALRNLAVVLEGDRNLFFRLTGYENAEYFIGLCGRSVKRAELDQAAGPFGFADALGRQVRTYSKGMRAKLSLIIALLSPGGNITLDEPDSGLDLPSVHELISIIKRMKGEGKSVLLATHQMNVAENAADNLVIINEGTVVGAGVMEELRLAYSHYRCVLELKSKVQPEVAGYDDTVEITDLGEGIWHIELSLPRTAVIPKLLQDIVGEDGRELLCMTVEKPTLEDVFLKLTEGKDATV